LCTQSLNAFRFYALQSVSMFYVEIMQNQEDEA
jgi:hypothetical protein